MINLKTQSLGIRVLLVLGMLLVMATASVDTPASVSAHGGDTTIVHLCVNDANAETLTVFPLPIGNANIDCVNPPWPLGPGWSPVDVGTILGVTAGTGLTGGGSTGTVNLNADTAFLQQRVSGICAVGSSIRVINQDGTVSCETDDVGIDGSGTLNFISKFTGAGTIGDSGIFEDALGNVGIGTANPAAILQVRDKPIDSGGFTAETDAGALIKSLNNNGGNTPAPPETALILAREGIDSEAYANFARFDLSRYEDVLVDSRTQLDIRLTHGPLNAEGNDTPTILSLQSGGNVGIGTTSPNEQLEITGNFRLPATTATTGIIKSGGNPFIHNIGLDNFFAGVNAGNLITTGTGRNTGVGFNALNANTTGFSNTAAGQSALQSNTTGISNTATGQGALQSNTTGISNTATGQGALQSNTTANFNTAVGEGALRISTGHSNTATGVAALAFNTTGFQNTAVGRVALITNTVGTFNTAIGYGADVGAGNLNNATAIGANAKVTTSDTIRLGTDDVTVEASGLMIKGDVLSTKPIALRIVDSGGSEVFRVQANGRIDMPGLGSFVLADSGLGIMNDGRIVKAVSSARYKKNIQPFDDNFDLMLQAELKSWTGLDGKGFGFGYIAEELDELGLTNLVIYDDQDRPESLFFRAISFYILEIVKRHNASIADHEARLAEKDTEIWALQMQVTELEDRLSAVEQAVGVSGSPSGSSLFGGLTMGLIFGGLLLVTPGLVVGYRRFNR